MYHLSWRRSRRRQRRQLWAPRRSISKLRPRLAAWSSFPAFGCVVASVILVIWWDFCSSLEAGCVVVRARCRFMPAFCSRSSLSRLLRTTPGCCGFAVPSAGRSLPCHVCCLTMCGSGGYLLAFVESGCPCLKKAGSCSHVPHTMRRVTIVHRRHLCRTPRLPPPVEEGACWWLWDGGVLVLASFCFVLEVGWYKRQCCWGC